MSSRDTPRTLRWAGARAFLVECGSLSEVMHLHTRFTSRPYPGQLDAVAAAETVLLAFTTRQRALEAARDVVDLGVSESGTASGKLVELDVVYDGEDLAAVGELTGLGERGVVEAHTGAEWTVAFGGFAPGFAYAVADGDPLDVPRRDTPRTAVPAGSVALAGRFSAVYPQRSPGGWQLIGHTDADLWDLTREDPALIRPGDTVRYRAVRDRASVTPAVPGTEQDAPDGGTPDGDPPEQNGSARPGPEGVGPGQPGVEHPEPEQPAARGDSGHALVIEEPGMQALLEDRGRPGLGNLGVVASGAADRASAEQANRLVGNPAGACVIEVLMGGLSVTARGHHALALAGAPSDAVIAGPYGQRIAPHLAPFALYDGEHLTLGAPSTGLRGYLSVRGGCATPAVLGSRSTDVMSGIGPEPLSSGDVVPVLPAPPGRSVGAPEPPAVRFPAAGELVTLRATPGPRDTWFSPAALMALTNQEWRVSNRSNRVGVRFEEPAEGAVLERSRKRELPSEGVVAGSLQVPHSGVPVLFLADHPVTGGYPVIAVVVARDLPVAAQLPPGGRVRFQIVDPGTGEPA